MSLSGTDNTGELSGLDLQEIEDLNCRRFLQAYKEAGVNAEINSTIVTSLGELAVLTRFYDLVIVDASSEPNVPHFSDLLHRAECPVLLLSSGYPFIQKQLFAFDGSGASMRAIKSAISAFPWLAKQPIDVVFIAANESQPIPFTKSFQKWMAAHFSAYDIRKITGNVTDLLPTHTKEGNYDLVIMGAFGRNSLSRLFHESLASALIASNNCSIIIGHSG